MKEKMNYMTVLKALGILLVVGGHMKGIFLDIGIPFYDDLKPVQIFPAYSYHMPLFIFASGYFFKEKYLEDFCLLFKKRLKSLIIPYYEWNLFYGLLCVFLVYINKPNDGEMMNLYNFFITPLLEGDQYDFNLPAWFLIVLFFVQIFYTIIKIAFSKKAGIEKVKTDNIILVLLTVVALGAIEISNSVEDITNYPALYFFSRIFFGMLFYHLGYYYKCYIEEKIDFNLFTLASLIGVKIILTLMLGKNFTFSMRTMLFRGVTVIPILYSILGILAIINISILIERFLEKYRFKCLEELFIFIGNNTFAIMMHHMFINFVFYKCFKYTLERVFIWNYLISPILCVALAIIFHKVVTRVVGEIYIFIRSLFKKLAHEII